MKTEVVFGLTGLLGVKYLNTSKTMYEARQFAIFATSELDQINFTEVLETSAETVRKSVDGTLTFVKWDGEEVPPSVQALTTIQGYYTYSEILNILSTPEWTSPMEEV
jgi:hypothetical protein